MVPLQVPNEKKNTQQKLFQGFKASRIRKVIEKTKKIDDIGNKSSTSPLRFPSPESKSCKLQRPGFNLSWSRESFRGDTLDTSKQHLSVEKISARYAIWSFGGRKKFGLNKIASPCWCIPYYSVVFLSSSSFRKYQGWHFPTPNMNLFSRETVRNISP